ncbi:hypothetical protein K450DRAFT_259491 [Umbelopsis ramanniana AG]|uniref:Sequence orphan n=1 Tax=Umbelopsis ramanniana AG TaxID=1314678 RepID=A0AAD5HAN8_UMBRA|nr:uncharacterized protein K450DRAFT_259491 [Umbelopsis ramanniana AG]KAI8575939.1 hypothetical protein K450DRAFT_259491 [Umbelopsis ramanniana AG]
MQSSCLQLLLLLLLCNIITIDAQVQRYDLVHSAQRSTHYLPAVHLKKRSRQPNYHINAALHPNVLIVVPGDNGAAVPIDSTKPSATTVANVSSVSSTATTATTTATNHDTGNSPATISTALSSNSTANYTQAVDSHLEVVLYCNIDTTFCKKVGNALGAAAYKLAQVVRLKSKLTIEVSYYSFCDNTCSNSTLGWGAPTSQFTLPNVGGVDPNYLYPQSLAKQLAPYNTTNWSAEDISIELNHDAYMSTIDLGTAKDDGWNGTGVPAGGHFWFQGDPDIRYNQVDMEYVILHELLHGMGFISSWGAFFYADSSPYHALVEDMFQPQQLQLLTPTPNAYTDTSTGASFIYGFQPTMIFDKFLAAFDPGNGDQEPNSLADLVVDLQQFCAKNNDAFIINFVRQFNVADVSAKARYLWNIANTNKTLFFNFPNLTSFNQIYGNHSYLKAHYSNLTMFTSGSLTNATEMTLTNFRPGVSISHVDDMYEETPDFLLRTTPILGSTLEQIIDSVYANIPAINYTEKVNSTTTLNVTYRSAIGPGILHVLDTMGYSTVLSNNNYSITTTEDIKQRNICTPPHVTTPDQTTLTTVKSAAATLPNHSILLLFVSVLCLIDFPRMLSL